MDLPIRPHSPPNLPQKSADLKLSGAQILPKDAALMAKAKALETSFLAEMLGHAGLDSAPEGFDGGIGEEQFSSFLREEQAKAMVVKGGIGLAAQIFHSLQERASDAN